MIVVEDTARVSIRHVRSLPSWPSIERAGYVKLRLEHHPDAVTATVEVESDPIPNGAIRWFLRCPCCGARRRHLYLVDDGLGCRGCGRMLYYVQALPDSAFRHRVAIPVLRAAQRRCSATAPGDQEAAHPTTGDTKGEREDRWSNAAQRLTPR